MLLYCSSFPSWLFTCKASVYLPSNTIFLSFLVECDLTTSSSSDYFGLWGFFMPVTCNLNLMAE